MEATRSTNYSPGVARSWQELLAFKGHAKKRKNCNCRTGPSSVNQHLNVERKKPTLKKRRVEIVCVQETKWKGTKSHDIGDGYEFICHGKTSGRNRVRIIFNESYQDFVTSVHHMSNASCLSRSPQTCDVLRIISTCAPKCRSTNDMKECFDRDFEVLLQGFDDDGSMMVGGDFNGHIRSSIH